MSAREVLATLTGALQDEASGLAFWVRELRGLTASGSLVRDDFEFDAWAPRTEGRPATAPLVVVTQAAARRELRQGVPKTPDYQAARRVTVLVQLWETDRRVLQDSVDTYEEALCIVLEGLRNYSDAHGGTVESVDNVVDVTDLSLSGAEGALSDGLSCDATINERSAE